jgi:hypothetical protein
LLQVDIVPKTFLDVRTAAERLLDDKRQVLIDHGLRMNAEADQLDIDAQSRLQSA